MSTPVPVTPTHVGPVVQKDGSSVVYYDASFKLGRYGKIATRRMWGNPKGEGVVVWERLSPEEMTADLNKPTLEIKIFSLDHKPIQFTGKDGKEKVKSSTRVVAFLDESEEDLLRQYQLEASEDAPTSGVAESFELVDQSDDEAS